jgi:Flp pilus assembly protein TadD
VAETNLGLVFLERGQADAAAAHFQNALRILSQSGQAHYDLSLALVHTDLGNALVQKGQMEEAVAHFEKATQLQPDYPDAHYNLGAALLQKGQVDEAIAQWRKTVSLRPADAEAHTSLANALLQKGALSEAISHYEAALQFAPDAVLPMNNLAWVLATSPETRARDGVRAVDLARRAMQRSDAKNPIFIRTLGAALAETGRFEPAQEAAERAEQLARVQQQPELAEEIERDIDGYHRGVPVRDSSLRNADPAH